ncbi:hypothetical protein ACA910_020423 [Epithemia clementina (nom. ined.)]
MCTASIFVVPAVTVSQEASTNVAQRPCHFEGLEHNNSVYTFYGVDVTDVHCTFTPEENSTSSALVDKPTSLTNVPVLDPLTSSYGGGRGRGHDGCGGRGLHIGNQLLLLQQITQLSPAR